MIIEQKDLVEQIVSLSERVGRLDLSSITAREAKEFVSITDDLTVATQAYMMRTALMKSFLMYSIVCVLQTIVMFRWLDVNPIIILFSNLAVAAAISAWMTYKLYLCSTAIESIFGNYDKFITRISQKEK